MLFARVAARRRAHETGGPELARDFGAPGVTPLVTNQVNPDSGSLAQVYRPSSLTGDRPEPGRADSGAERIGSQRISLHELRRLQESGETVLVLDVRTDRSMETSDLQAQGAVRLPPEHVVERARELQLPKDAWLIAYCA